MAGKSKFDPTKASKAEALEFLGKKLNRDQLRHLAAQARDGKVGVPIGAIAPTAVTAPVGVVTYSTAGGTTRTSGSGFPHDG